MTLSTTTEPLAALTKLLGEVNDLKRIYSPDHPRGLADEGFRRSWADILEGENPADVARREAAYALISAKLGAIDFDMLIRGGLTSTQAVDVLRRAFGEISRGVSEDLRKKAELGLELYLTNESRKSRALRLPKALERLTSQPRAGATCPELPRLILEPPESHGGHCYVTAVMATILAPSYGADPGTPFVAALSHHLHNAFLPDSGFAGEMLLGEYLSAVMERFTEDALAELPDEIADLVRGCREVLTHAETPEAKAFHAADVIDRVLQMRQYARVAMFRLEHALEDLELVHAGPLQSFQIGVLREAGLWTSD